MASVSFSCKPQSVVSNIIELCLCRFRHVDMGSKWLQLGHLCYNMASLDMVQLHKYLNLHYPIFLLHQRIHILVKHHRYHCLH